MTHGLLSCLLPLILLAGCSSASDGDQDAAATAAPSEDPTAADAQGAPSAESPPPVAPAANVPAISARSYVGGTARVTVTGAFQIDEDVAINKQASISDGTMTWLQYGVSGAETPNALVTVSESEVGINVAHGKPTATIGAESCKGNMDVAATSITGHYICKDVTSYDPRSGNMGKIDIDINFTASS